VGHEACDAWATSNNCRERDPVVWEITLANGQIAAVVPDYSHVLRVDPDGRAMAVYSFDEIARLLAGFPELVKAKELFPGATVEAVRRTISSPLDGIEADRPLDDPLPF
jgi:hypothetical protein